MLSSFIFLFRNKTAQEKHFNYNCTAASHRVNVIKILARSWKIDYLCNSILKKGCNSPISNMGILFTK